MKKRVEGGGGEEEEEKKVLPGLNLMTLWTFAEKS